MNQIIKIIIRQVMHQLIRRGVSAGIDQASRVKVRRRGANTPQHAGDEAPQMTREERRAKRLARQQSRQARAQMKATKRISKF